jgi:hypothetical protein
VAENSISGVGLASILAGSVFLYAGLKGKTVLGSVQAVISGKSPATGASAGQITGSGTTTISPSSELPGGSVGGTFTHADLMNLWTSNGGDPNAANNAACHAIQESSGEPAVTSSNPDGGTNVGLWQLDTKGKGAGYTVAQLQDPATNARVAIMGSANGSDWSAWATPGC